ncbi:MAG: glycosyltransferase family 39 protein [Candidatus Hydrogenedentes bacterium]|nr:glycosyltransferase family 39 protein [Candidatus Hydrogenedentota bacterium]
MGSMDTPEHTEKNPVSPGAAFWGVLAVAACLRLYALGRHALWYDEGASVFLARYVDLHGSLFRSEFTTEPPMMAILSWIWQGLLSPLPISRISWEHDAALRLLPAGFGLASVACVYFGAHALLHDRRAALGAMAAVAVAPLQIYYAQEFRIYTFYVLLALLASGCMIRAVESGERKYWIGMVACLTILMYSHFISMFLIFTLNAAFVLALPWHYRQLRPWFLWNLLLMLLIAPALYLAFRMQGHVDTQTIPWYPPPTWKTALVTAKIFFAAYTPRAWAYWPLFLLGLAGTGWGLFSLRQRPLLALTALALVAVPVTLGLLIWGRAHFSFYEHRLFLYSGTVAVLLCGIGLARLPRLPAMGLSALALVFVLPCLNDVYAQNLHRFPLHNIAMWDKVDFRSAARHIEDHWQEGDLIAHVSHFGIYSMPSYLDKPQKRLGMAPSDLRYIAKLMGNAPLLIHHDIMPVMLEKATAGAKRLWLLRCYGITFEDVPYGDALQARLEQDWTPVETRHYDGVVLRCYVRKDAQNGSSTP